MSSSNLSKAELLSSNSGQSRSQSSDISSTASSDIVENRLKFEHSIDHTAVLSHVESHKKRLKKLRKELNYLQETAWKYQSIEKILVLTPNGRRQNVKITPNTTLLQVLEEVCSKHGFKPEDYDIRHHNKILDVSSIFRFTGLPNNALLEMTEVKKQRSESKVVLGLHLESGDRLTGEFIPSDNLWDVVLSLNPEVKSLSNPVIIYMRNEIHGRENLEKTTLRNLGLTGGRAVIRLLNRTPEELRTQANVSAVLSRPAEIKEKDIDMRAEGQPSKGRDSPYHSKLSSSPEKNKTKGEKEENKELSPYSVKKVYEEPNEMEKSMDTSQHKKAENVTAESRNSGEDNIMKSESSKNVLVKPANQSPEAEEDVSQAILLGERSAVAFSMNNVKPAAVIEEPDDFFELTVSDAKLLLQDARQVCTELENAPLMTSAQREFEKNKKILSLLNQYKKTVLRIKFPDSTVLQGTFSSVEKVSAVEKFVAEYLENPDISFYLYTTPPKEILESEKNLLEVNCVPSAILYFGIRSETEKIKQFLRSDIMEKFSSPSAAALTAYKSRGLMESKISRDKEVDSEANITDKSDVVSVAGPSTSSSSSEKKPESGQEVSPPLKVPKWFKITK